MEQIKTDVCVIGAGSGGLSVAAGASQLGARVVLLERGEMGGDCLNYGCVPSKALIAAGRVAEAFRGSGQFGIIPVVPEIAYEKVHDHVNAVVAAIKPNDSVERFEGLGVNVIKAAGKFVGSREVAAGEVRISAKYFVVATGSCAVIPPIQGLADVPYLTNETIFNLRECPKHLIVVGGGPIGCELAQAYRRLGAKVTVVEMFRILSNDDPEAAEVVRRQFRREGVELCEGMRVSKVQSAEIGVAIEVAGETGQAMIMGSHILIAVGRKPNVDGLDLDVAGIAHSQEGINVDTRLRTTNKRVFAIGDVVGPFQFTHVAGYHAGIVIRNALFKLPAKADYRAVPRVTYTEPELANVGLTEAEAKRRLGKNIRILRWPFAENDRAQTERRLEGFVKVIVDRKGKIYGACVIGPHAGELILPWVLAVDKRLKIGAMASIVAPYPTLGEMSKRAAGSFYTASLFGERTKKLVRFLLRF